MNEDNTVELHVLPLWGEPPSWSGQVHNNNNNNITPQAIYGQNQVITLTRYMVLPLFAAKFADYAGGIRVSFIQPCLCLFNLI